MDKKQVKKELKKLSELRGYNIKNIVKATKQMERVKFNLKDFAKGANQIAQAVGRLKKFSEAVRIKSKTGKK